MPTRLLAFVPIAVAAVAPIGVSAEVELSFYSGVQESPHSQVTGNDMTLGPLEFTAGWEGKSFAMPPYYGLRATWWRTDTLGFGVQFTHDKVYADPETLAASGLSTLEFTDGLNILTANVVKRWPGQWGALTPYVGGGVGVALPHVEIQAPGGPKTFEYQYTGPAVRWFAGVKYDLTDDWALFGEYEGTYSMNDAHMVDGGTLSTNIITTALNIGISYSF